MLSLDLRQILPPKMPFFMRQKLQIFSKILPQISKFANFVKLCQKRNPLEPIDYKKNRD